MQLPHHHPRINLADLKALMVKKLGPDRSNQYFSFLNMFLSLKLTKVEFNKLCLRVVGRENIPLHNQLIRSILINACHAKVPPPAGYKDDVLNHDTQVRSKGSVADGYWPNGSHNGATQASCSLGLSNGGDMLPLSPRKARTGLRDRRSGRSALAPYGKTGFVPPVSAQSNDFNVLSENGDSHPSDIVRHEQHYRGPKQQLENKDNAMVFNAANVSTAGRLLDGSVSSCSDNQTKSIVGDGGNATYAWSPVRAPFGVPFISQAHGALPPAKSCMSTSTLNDVSLLDSLALRERMVQIATEYGLEGVSVDSANILNHGLDSYLKGLIKSCVQLVESRSDNELTKSNTDKPHDNMKLINGFRPGHQPWMQGNRMPLEVQEQKTRRPISVHDFRVSMELNPQKLGEDWPLLLEKICTHAFEE